MGASERPGSRRRESDRRSIRLADLKRELEARGAYDETVRRGLEFGDVWWIPDDFTNVGFREGHPWIVVVPYEQGRAAVWACLRTTKDVHSYGSGGVVTPANVLEGLNEEGCILLFRRQQFSPADFASFRHIGRLPEEWCARLRRAIDALGESTAGQGEGG